MGRTSKACASQTLEATWGFSTATVNQPHRYFIVLGNFCKAMVKYPRLFCATVIEEISGAPS